MVDRGTRSPEIVVVGSVNVDVVVRVATLPRPGETVLAAGSRTMPGGKGGNQAMASARLGRRVAMVGRCGTDQAADLLRMTLLGEGIDVTEFRSLPDATTGQALVLVDDAAENSIVVIPGANAALTAEDVQAASYLVAAAPVVVAQLEVPLAAVEAAADACRGTFVLNAAPAFEVPASLLGKVDVLVVNQTEFSLVVGGDPDVPADRFATELCARSGMPGRIVVTRGGLGARVWDDSKLTDVPAPAVQVVDTTGAGDTFVGALADALSRGESLVEASRWAVAAASLSTTSLGATSAMPTWQAVRTLLADPTSDTSGVGTNRPPSTTENTHQGNKGEIE